MEKKEANYQIPSKKIYKTKLRSRTKIKSKVVKSLANYQPKDVTIKVIGVGDDQIASDEMGGGRCSDANFDVMGDVGQSNVDDDLHSQPDQNVDHSNVLDEFLDVQPNPNQGEAIDFCESNVLGLRVSSPVLEDLNKHQNKNTGDLRGGVTITGENLDAMGVVSQSNFDDDLHRQPD